jgi:hypothetical protein
VSLSAAHPVEVDGTGRRDTDPGNERQAITLFVSSVDEFRVPPHANIGRPNGDPMRTAALFTHAGKVAL